MKIVLPDGSEKQYDQPDLTAYDVARDIGEKLAEAAIGARINGELVDVRRPIRDVVAEAGQPVTVSIITAPRVGKDGKSRFRDEQHQRDALYLLRHSCAHVMAEAICRLWPDTQLAYGPPLDNGFYYDLKLDTPISSDDFPRIEAQMKRIVEENRPFTRYELDVKAGFKKLTAEGNRYKVDNANRAVDNGANMLSWYVTGWPRVINANGNKAFDLGSDICVPFSQRNPIPTNERVGLPISWDIVTTENFEDLCQGPHVDCTSRIGAFKVMSIASSHWHGDITQDRFQRVYGTAFFTEADLDEYLAQLEEAKKRDHRVIGQRLGLFHIDDAVGQGLVLWKPKGAVIRDELQKFISEHLRRQGYAQVFTPHIGKLGLYKTSGHFPYYQDSQYPPLIDHDQMRQLSEEKCDCATLANMMRDGDIDGYLLKPMNCPHHIRIYASEKHSYRDLPIRLAEFGTVYRWEQSGELSGMTRVRGFTQDDAHIFCTEDQVAHEVRGCLELVKIIFNTLGMSDYRVRVGLRDPDSTKYVGKPENWQRAEAACQEAAASLGVSFSEEPGEAAFYGPKIDFVVRDVIGREWQLGTVQVDYNLPERFKLEYIGADNQPHRPVMIHRAPFGSMERFVGVLIEHFNGAFPLWLSPEQVRILPISDKFLGYGQQVLDALKKENLRVTLDDSNERVNAKIKAAQEEKIPYMLIVGGKDEQAGTVSVRDRVKGDVGAVPLARFVKQVEEEMGDRR